MSVGSSIKKLRELHGLTQEELGKIADVSAMAVSQWENERAVPRMGAVQRIADYFGITKGEIIDDSPKSSSLIPGARPAKAARMVKVPVLGRVHAGPAGEPDVFNEEPDEAEIPAHYLDVDPECYVLDFEGDCMSKDFGETTSLVVSPNSSFGSGSIVVAVIDGADYVVRRMEQNAKGLVLKPNSWNPTYEAISIPRDSEREVEFKGKVLGCFKRFE